MGQTIAFGRLSGWAVHMAPKHKPQKAMVCSTFVVAVFFG
jgi:hypothetical protein